MISLVIPVFNQLEYTGRCLESLFRNTPEPYELLVVDNASADGTADFLAGLRPPAVCRRFHVIRNESNLGVAKGWNQGLGAAAGDPVGFLNNDIVLTPGWLSGVLSFLRDTPQGGIAGPHVTDGALPPGYDDWARHYTAENAARVDEGFHGCCFFVTRALIAAVGGFDEGYAMGGWEDVDYGHRARLAGFRTLITHRSVVHHFGSRTMSALDGAYGDFGVQNAQHFSQKWDIPLGRFVINRSLFIPLE